MRLCNILQNKTIKYHHLVCHIYSVYLIIYVWIYENSAKVSPETISKVDDIKIKKKVSPFFPPLLVYLPFIALLSLFFACLHGLEKA